MTLTCLEICAGAGGQAIGLEEAGFEHVALIENENKACESLRANRPAWRVLEQDVRTFDATNYHGVDLLAGGVPCPPFSVAGKQLGRDDERDLFPEAIRLVSECRPRAVMLENVRGLLHPLFDSYRVGIERKLRKLGYTAQWKLLNACNFGVPQLRPRVILVAIKRSEGSAFEWPQEGLTLAPTVGATLFPYMSERKWRGAARWRALANTIAPTLVGGSKKHGGPDLGPTRAKRAWAALGVDGHGLANESPSEDFVGMPRLTVRMTAAIQGFRDDWSFMGGKTAAYRQIGNAFPPPVAAAVGKSIFAALMPSASAVKCAA